MNKEVSKLYVRVKVFDGRVYRYLVRGIRINGIVKQKVVKYIGPINPIYKIKKKRKSNASVFVRVLTEKEQSELTDKLHSNNVFVRDRAKIILLSSEKTSAVAIALKTSCDIRKVRAAIKAFNKKGLGALQRRKAKGAIPKFTESTKKIILMHYSRPPREFGCHFTTWTLPRFRKHLIECKVVDSISIETVRQIIMKAGAKLKRSKRWQYSPDKDFVKKNLR